MSDVGETIPLFPLSHVLVPGMPLPLHIFEPRYRKLLADVGDSGAFGVVALRTGTEALSPQVATSGPDVEAVGTLAEILEVQRDASGTADVLAIGSRRFRLEGLLVDGEPYLRGSVEYLDEPDGALTPEQVARARSLLDLYDTTLRRVAGRETGDELPTDANQLSYQLAARLPLGPGERQELLADPTTAERLIRVTRFLRRELVLLQRTRSVAVSPAMLRMGTGAN